MQPVPSLRPDVAAAARELLLPLLQPLGSAGCPGWLDRVRPQPADFAAVFASAAVELASRVYSRMWQDPPAVVPALEQTILHLAIASAAEFTAGIPPGFPLGYAKIAAFLQPMPIWVTWRFVEPAQTHGLAFDGLVYLDGRWAWFPKPYRHLNVLGQPHSHYQE